LIGQAVAAVAPETAGGDVHEDARSICPGGEENSIPGGGYQIRIFQDLALKQPQSHLSHGEDFFLGEDFVSLSVQKVFAIMKYHGIWLI
jgi:hypothetical protein